MPAARGRGANFGWNCFEGTHAFFAGAAVLHHAPANHTPPVLEYPHPGHREPPR